MQKASKGFCSKLIVCTLNFVTLAWPYLNQIELFSRLAHAYYIRRVRKNWRYFLIPSPDRSFFLSKKRTFRGSKIAIFHKKLSNKKIKVNSTCPIMISLTSLFLITLINSLKKIKNATQSCLTDHG